MPTYRFSAHGSSSPDFDPVERECGSDELAMNEAAKALTEMLLAELAEGNSIASATVRVERGGQIVSVASGSVGLTRS